METVSITLSAKARETAFAVCRNRKYATEQLMAASGVLKKLREGAEASQVPMKDPNGQPLEVTVYKGFLNNVVMEISFDERDIISNTLRGLKEWHPEETDVVIELQEQLQIKLI